MTESFSLSCWCLDPPSFLAASGTLGRGTFIYCPESSVCRVNTAWLVEQGTTCCFLSHTHMNPQMHANTRRVTWRSQGAECLRHCNHYAQQIDSHRRRDKLTQTSITLKTRYNRLGGLNCYNGRENLSLLGRMTGPTPTEAGSCLWQDVTAFAQVSLTVSLVHVFRWILRIDFSLLPLTCTCWVLKKRFRWNVHTSLNDLATKVD